MPTMTLADVIQDIHAMDEELWHYEARYGLRSQYFFELYKAGQLRDEDPSEVRDYTDWAACFEIKRHREQLDTGHQASSCPCPEPEFYAPKAALSS